MSHQKPSSANPNLSFRPNLSTNKKRKRSPQPKVHGKKVAARSVLTVSQQPSRSNGGEHALLLPDMDDIFQNGGAIASSMLPIQEGNFAHQQQNASTSPIASSTPEVGEAQRQRAQDSGYHDAFFSDSDEDEWGMQEQSGGRTIETDDLWNRLAKHMDGSSRNDASPTSTQYSQHEQRISLPAHFAYDEPEYTDDTQQEEDPYDIPKDEDLEKEHNERMHQCLEEVHDAMHNTVPLTFPYHFSINNLVLSAHLSGGLNVSKLYTRLKNTELKSHELLQFQCATNYGRVVCTIRSSGKLTTTGSKTVKEALKVVRFVAALAETYNAVENNYLPIIQIRYCRVVNIVAGTDLRDSIRLDHLHSLIQKELHEKAQEKRLVAQGNQDSLSKAFLIDNVVYEPEVGADLKVRFVKKVVMQLFANGRMQMMGASKMQQFYDYSEYLMPLLKQSMGIGKSEQNAIFID
eukprot:CAMPEP_0117441516 /NCGR_PEP_ID=MMETSP0759-20121206/3675_1 /TAXON_ID=63605 /ORGANISM="Percolomonas cosmopolitus, Strain WS" /LENGTH=460 /DNA_ID=CAMNT_0005233373 /DNA_START=28 /DNA_END=1410 /DNA_ORIENTATION=-